MKTFVATVLVAAVVGTAVFAGGPRSGCYQRDYTQAHLSSHPDQIVDQITLLIRKDDYGETVASMRVLTANQGHVALSGHGNQLFDQFLICWADGARTGCSVECDGGRFEVTRDTGKALTFRTRNLWVGNTDECGGAIDLAERPGQPVSYRLNKVGASACSGM